MYNIFSNEPLSATEIIELCTETGFEMSKVVSPARLSYVLWHCAIYHMKHGGKDIDFNEFKKIYLKQAIEVAKNFKLKSISIPDNNFEFNLEKQSNYNLYALYWWTHVVVTNLIPIEYAIEIIATLIGSFTTVKDDESSSEKYLAWVVLAIFWFQFFHHLVTKLKHMKYQEALTNTEKVLKTLKYTGKMALYTGLTLSTKESANGDLSEMEFSISNFFKVMFSNFGGGLALFGIGFWLIGDTGDRVVSLCKKLDKTLRPGLHNGNNQVLLGNQSIQ